MKTAMTGFYRDYYKDPCHRREYVKPSTLNPRPPTDIEPGGFLWPLQPYLEGIIPYLEGYGDLVSRLITPITHLGTLVILIINLLTKSP